MAHYYKVRTFFLGDEGMDLASLEKRFYTPTPLAVPEAQRQTPLARLMVRASELMAEYLAQREVAYRQQFFEWDEDEIGHPAPTQPEADHVIDVVFYTEKSLIHCYDVDENSLGFHAVTDPVADRKYAEESRVFVHLDLERLLDLALEQRQEEADPSSDRYDDEYLSSYVNTISHELVHAIEWIEHTNGVDTGICEMVGLYAGEITGGYGAIDEVTKLFDERPEDTGGKEDPYFQVLLTSEEWAEQRAEEGGRKILDAIWPKLVEDKAYDEVRDWMAEELASRLTPALNP